MCKDNCGWTITAVAGEPTSKLDPVFDPSFDAHMKGEISGKGELTGCHTLYGRDASEREFVKSKETGNEKFFAPATNDKVYSAKVKLKTGKGKLSAEKLSSFWPDDMCLECVRGAIVIAWKHYKGLVSGGQDEGLGDVMANKVKWTGDVEITKKKDSFKVSVGSPQTGSSNSKISTAYPKVKDTFF